MLATIDTKRAGMVAACSAKKKYGSEQTAIMMAARYVGLKYNRKAGKSLRTYRCPICHFWHLTSHV